MTRSVIGLYVVSSILASTAFAQENAAGTVRPTDAVAGPSTPAVENPAPAALVPPAATPKPPAEAPWRATEALGAPTWLRFGLEQRTRFENLQNDFRSTSTGNSRGLSLRTLLSAEMRFNPLTVAAELEDSRIYASKATPLNTNIVDSLDVLQAYASLRREGLLAAGDAASLTVGRFTMDLGSRRLVARNGFRNTINSFTGVSGQWTSTGRTALRVFAVMPVLRLPTDAEALEDNGIKLDKENTDALFTGVYFTSAPLPASVQLEAYALGLFERDSADAPSANRRLYTPGVRVLRAPAPGQLDFQVEGMLQLGTSRATAKATDTTDLRHRAWSVSIAGGYKLDAPWTPRVALLYDYASGDRNPTDKSNERFDPLFGARGPDFGPTGLYGVFARSNISSPGVRVEAAPHRTVNVSAAYRLVWLASSRDQWTTAGLRDDTGASGGFVGREIQAAVRWQLLPKNVVFDVGAAYLMRGRFARTAPNARDAQPFFVYTQVTFTI